MLNIPRIIFLKILALLLPLFFFINFSQAQKLSSIWISSLGSLSEKDKIKKIAEMLLKDTIKFNQEDIYYTSFGVKNKTDYSPLIIVNNTNIYKMDIMDNKCAKIFVQNFLLSKNLKHYSLISFEEAKKIYGSAGKNGVISLKIKKHNSLKKHTCKSSQH